jgi:hypothetical protein
MRISSVWISAGSRTRMLVTGQPVPFAGQRGDDLGGGRVQQALLGVAGLQARATSNKIKLRIGRTLSRSRSDRAFSWTWHR